MEISCAKRRPNQHKQQRGFREGFATFSGCLLDRLSADGSPKPASVFFPKKLSDRVTGAGARIPGSLLEHPKTILEKLCQSLGAMSCKKLYTLWSIVCPCSGLRLLPRVGSGLLVRGFVRISGGVLLITRFTSFYSGEHLVFNTHTIRDTPNCSFCRFS